MNSLLRIIPVFGACIFCLSSAHARSTYPVQDTLIAICPDTLLTFCDTTVNNPDFWNQSLLFDPVISSHDLCEGESSLYFSATGPGGVSITYDLFLDLDGDGVQETVVSSLNPPGPGVVNFGNAANPGYLGGQALSFDNRAVTIEQKFGFTIQLDTTGGHQVCRVAWHTTAAPEVFLKPQLPYGRHKIRWTVIDYPGEKKVCESWIVVKDCKKPTLNCLPKVTVSITYSGAFSLIAADLYENAIDNCTPQNLLQFGVRRAGEGSGFPSGPNSMYVTFYCCEAYEQYAEIWVRDKADNIDSCTVLVEVTDPNGNCEGCYNNVKLQGIIATENAAGVCNVQVQNEGSSYGLPQFVYGTVTDNLGHYNFNALPIGSNSETKPHKNDFFLNGVTTYDLVLISKHILGVQPLGSPYKMIAADANKSGSITTFDLVQLRRLILGLDTVLSNNTSWRFIDKYFTFPNPNNPFVSPFPETKFYINATTNKSNGDFVAVKIGDVNLSAIANSAQPLQDRTDKTWYLDVQTDRETLKPGEIFTARFTASEWVEGYQFTLNTPGLEIMDILPGAGMTPEEFAVFEDAMTTSHVEAAPTAPASFFIMFRAKTAGRPSDLLSISSRITQTEAYAAGSSGSGMGVALRFADGVETGKLPYLEFYPNPVTTGSVTIRYQLPEGATGSRMQIYNEMGQAVQEVQLTGSRGKQEIHLDHLPAGVYAFLVKCSGSRVLNGKFTVAR
jgi:hypothetical protein